MTAPSCVARWLEPLAPSLPELEPWDWEMLGRFESRLAQLTASAPRVTAPLDVRSAWLLDLRRRLTEEQRAGVAPSEWTGDARPALCQALRQVVCGFYDLDLRDAVGDGHGALIMAGGTEVARRGWSGRLAAGELVGIAATERHGGSRVQELTTRATLCHSGMWTISGEKAWVSRLLEASAFVVFFRDPDSRTSAVVVEATAPGMEREPITPAGLAGWSWGVLRLHEVRIDPAVDLLGRSGSGLELFRRHFTRFRPLVTATAAGTAAGVHTAVADALAARTRIGLLPRVRDNALIALGRVHAELVAVLLSAFATTRMATTGHPQADLWARVGKAHGVETANRAVTDLAVLVGAAGFQAASPLAKARADLAGLLYADGIHDSLYRSGGQTLLEPPSPAGSVDRDRYEVHRRTDSGLHIRDR